jgi:sulfur relay (sulfurtransferase) complex TusBCD TusD component (DsrE family)
MRTVIVLNRDQMGHGDADLGVKILGTCLRKLGRFEGLKAIVLYNAGVKLATKVSPVATELNILSHDGVDLLACGTCVEHYGIEDDLIVDHISTMDEILRTMQAADKVITL